MTTGFQSVCTYPRLYSCGEKVWPCYISSLWCRHDNVLANPENCDQFTCGPSEFCDATLLLFLVVRLRTLTPASPLLLFPGLKFSAFSLSLFCYLRLSRPELTVVSRRVRLSEAWKLLSMHMITLWRACDNMHNYCCQPLLRPTRKGNTLCAKGHPVFQCWNLTSTSKWV